MKTVTTAKAWILICSIIVVSSATTDHASSHHDVPDHGDSIPQNNHQNTIVPFGIEVPEHVLPKQDVACISADSNIFEIMNKAQATCNGTDMRCTFYHFVNHGYKNIGTLNINKELFDDLLMKFDNWLLTAENIEKDDVPIEAKTKKHSSLDVASFKVNGSHKNEEPIDNSIDVSETERLFPNQGVHIDKVDHNTNKSDDDKIINIHHTYDTHHKNHHHKWKNGNHIKLIPEYNNDHRYFEVFLPKDTVTGKPRTIYVEVDKEKNEFILLDEEIDRKLNGTKPIRIELDELSEIADSAFNNIAKSSIHKEHINSNLYNHEISDLNTNSELHKEERRECTQNILNSSVRYPNISNINANQHLIQENTTGISKKIINFSKNLVVPNKYINQAQFNVESQIDNTRADIPNDHLELLESSNNEIDIHQTGFNEETLLDTIEFNGNNTNINLDLESIIECSPENFNIACDENSTENYKLSTEHDNITSYDDYLIHLEENNDTSIGIDFDESHDFSSSEIIHLNEPTSENEKHVEENELKSTPKLTSTLTAGISEYSSPQLDAITSENRQGHSNLQAHSPEPDILLSPYTTVPLLGKNLAKVLETDGHLQSSFPVHGTSDLPVSGSQKTLLDADIEHPSISSYDSPLDSNFSHGFFMPKTFQSTFPICPSPPVECVVRLNKGCTYSPLNFGFSWLPSYSRIEELRLPFALGPLSQESILPVLKNEQLSDSTCPELSSDVSVEEPTLYPSLRVDIQKPSLTTEPYNLEVNAPIPPKNVFLSKLNSPKSSTYLDSIPTPYQLSESPLSVMPSLKSTVNPPCPVQQTSPYFQPTNNQDFRFIKYSPFDNNSKETMTPCASNQNRYPYTTIPYFPNPYVRPPQLIPAYLEPQLAWAPLQPSYKIPTLDSVPLSSGQSKPCPIEDYSKITKRNPLMTFAVNTPFSPLNPLSSGSNLVPNTLPCPNLWNNIASLPYTIIPDQNIRNYPPIVSNYLNPSAGSQQNQFLKTLLSTSVPLSTNKEITPSSYTPFLPIYTPPEQKDLNLSLALERDLQSLSMKYGIPLSKILNSLETEIRDDHSKTCSTLEVPYSNLVHDSSLIKPVLSKTNAVLDDQNKSAYEESLSELDIADFVPLDSSLIGPHLEIEGPLILETKGSQSHTVVSETIVPTLHSKFKNQSTMLIHDSSLIGPHLSTLSSSNIVLSDENRNANHLVISESDYSNSISLDSSLIGPHLEIGSPPIELDHNNFNSDIFTSHTDVPITVSSQIEPILQNQQTNVILDSSLIGSHLPSLSTVKPLVSNEIPTIMETDITDLTPLDSSAIETGEYAVNQLDQTEILQHEETAVKFSAANASPELNKAVEYLHTNLVEEKSLLESDSSSLISLDSSLIGPELKIGSSPSITDSLEDKTVPLVSKESLQNTHNKIEELKRIILPPSLLPTLLDNPVKADSNLNIITQETKLNEELEELSLDINVELPLTDISHVSFNETDFKIVEPIPELTSVIEDGTLKQQSKLVDSEPLFDSSLTGVSILDNLKKSGISSSFDSSNNFDSSIIASQEISPILGSESSLAHTTISQNKKPSEFLTAIDSSTDLGSSFKGPTFHNEINLKETSTAFESVTQFDNSLVPSLHETKESAATTSVLNSSYLDSSLIGPSLHQETIDVSHAFDSKDHLDSSIVGPHLFTAVPFSSDEIQMINEELQSKSNLVNLTPLDSSLIGPHLDFESELQESEISRYQNAELSKTTVTNNEVYESTDFVPSYLDEGKSHLELSDYQELLTKFKNAITKSQLSPSELKPCDKLLSSIAEISSENYALPSCKDLQTLTLNTLLNTSLSLQDELASEFSPIIITSPAQAFSPGESIPKSLDSNYFQIPQILAESLPYAQGIPHIPTMPYSPFVQMKPLINRNWLGPNNIQNILQTTPCFKPVVGNVPVPLMSNALPLTSEDLKSLLGLASHGKLYPQLSSPDVYTPGNSNMLPLNQYIPLLPKNISPVLPSNSESLLSNSEYSPTVVDDIMSLLDENSQQLLKDQSSLPHIIPVFEKGEIGSPSLLETVPILDSDVINTGPLLSIPITNPLIPSSIYNPQLQLYNPQNVLSMIQTPNISPCNLKPYSNLPLHSEFTEIVGPAPKVVSLPTQSPKSFLQQQLSKPYVESPNIFPSLLLDSMLQLPTASNELNSVPCQLPPEYFTPIAPISPIYANPLSVSYDKPISTPTTTLALNVPYIDSPLTPVHLPMNPITARPFTPKYSSPIMPIKLTLISNYPYQPTVEHNIPIPSEIPYKPTPTYSSPYLPVHPSLIPIDTSLGSPNIMSKRLPAMPSPVSPVLSEPLSTAYFSPLSKSSTSLGLPTYSAPLAPTSTSLLPPSYYSHTSSYLSVPGPINTQTRPSNLLKPMSDISSYYTPIRFNLISSPNPKIKPELQKLRSLNTLPISNVVNPFLITNQRLPINPSQHVPTSKSNTQIMQNIPCERALELNLLTSPLAEEIPPYDVIEKSAYAYRYDKDDKYYEELTSKYPLESLSYTLAPEEVAETLSNEDYVELKDLTPSAPASNRASEPSLQAKFYQPLRVKPPLHGKPVLKPHPASQLLQPLSLIETIPENLYDNIPPVPSSSPLKHPVSLPTSIFSSPLLKPLSPLTFAPIDTSRTPYSQLPLSEKLQSLSSSPHYSAPSQDRSSPSISPAGLKKVVNSQVSPAFSQIPTNAPFVTVSSPMNLPNLQPTASVSLLDNYFELPLTHYKPKSKPLSLSSLVKPLPIPSYTQNAAPVTSHISPLEMSMASQYISSPISASQSLKKTKPSIFPPYISSILPTQTRLQDSSPLNKAPIYYQPYTKLPTALTSTTNNVFRSPPVTSPYTMLPSANIVDPIIADLTRPQWSSFTPQYSIPALSLPVPSSHIVSHSNIPYSKISTQIPNQALTHHIIPSSLLMSPDTDFQTPKNKLSTLYNIPRYSLPSPFITEPLQSVPFYTPSRPLDTLANQLNILKLKSPLSNVKYTDPLFSSPYFSQPLEPADSYQTQPLTNVLVQYTAKAHPKSSPRNSYYASPSSEPMYSSLPLETGPKWLTNNPSALQYSPSNALVYDSKIHSSPLGRNPFLNPDFKPITEVPSYPVPKNIISSSTPSESILLTNLRPLDISTESQNSYSVPVSYTTQFSPSSLLKPSAKRLPQNSCQYKPHIISSNLQCVSQSPMNNAPQLLPSTSPLLKSPLLQSLFANSQDNSPLVPMHVSNTKSEYAESFPMESVTSVTSPNIALSNYLPFDSSNKYSGPCNSDISEIQTPINPLYTTPYIFLKSPFNKQVNTLTNMPFNSREATPEKENMHSLFNKYRPANNIIPIGPYESKPTISEVFSELDSLKPVNPLLKKELYTEYIENFKSNEDNEYDHELENIRLDENKPNVTFKAKPIINLPGIIKGLSIPDYIQMAQRPQKSSKFDHFYANNHIGKSPQVFNVPTSPIDSTADVASPYTTITPENLKDSTDIPTKHFGYVPKLESTPFRPNEYYPEIPDSPEITPTTNSYPQNYLNPCLKYRSQMISSPNTIDIADTSEIIPNSYKNIDDIKYSGYKSYQIPSFKSPQNLHSLGTPTQMYSPSVVTYSSAIPAVKPLNIQPTPSLLYSSLYSPTEISEPIIPQYQTPLQTKLGLDSLQESSEFNEYNTMEDVPPSVDSINEDTELKTSLINYLNNREDVKNNLYNNNAELTIPLGDIAITRKDPYNANTIETNNPSIGLKVWKSNVKIAQAELKLKFKDLSVDNFMPIVNNLDKYDMDEIRKIVKNYIDEKYGNHLEVNEPYTIDNKYTIIKDFDHNAVDNKYNLLWPTNYV